MDSPVTPEDFTLLHLAVMQGQARIVKALLMVNVNRNAQDVNGNTPLHLAFKYGFKSCIAVLLDGECDEDIENNFGKRPAEL